MENKLGLVYTNDKCIGCNKCISVCPVATANHAIEQGKEVWVVPGDIFSKQSEGTNHLIKDGANVLTKICDICNK